MDLHGGAFGSCHRRLAWFRNLHWLNGPPWRSFASLKVRNWNRTRRFNDLRSSICLTDLHWLNRPPWRSIRQASSLSKRKTQPTSSHRSPSPLITTRPAYPPMRHRPLTTACSPLTARHRPPITAHTARAWDDSFLQRRGTLEDDAFLVWNGKQVMKEVAQ